MSVKRFDIMQYPYSGVCHKQYSSDGDYADGEIAQDLYDALDAIDKAYGSGSNDDKVSAWDKALKAMAKARGES